MSRKRRLSQQDLRRPIVVFGQDGPRPQTMVRRREIRQLAREGFEHFVTTCYSENMAIRPPYGEHSAASRLTAKARGGRVV